MLVWLWLPFCLCFAVLLMVHDETKLYDQRLLRPASVSLGVRYYERFVSCLCYTEYVNVVRAIPLHL